MDKDKEKISLLKKTSRYFLLINAFLMLLGTVVLYFYTRSIMQNEVEEELYSRSFRLEHYVSSNSQVIELPPVFEVKEVEHLRPEVIKDTLIYDPSQDEMEKFRELTTYRNLNGNNYQIIVRSMMVETEEIILIIFFLFCIILLIIFLVQFYFNRAWYKRLWKPFFLNLEKMKQFSLPSNPKVELVQSDILEFSELKDQMEELMQKVNSDYQNLKQFTENVSHELQTPLAVMQARIENLLNGHHLDTELFSQLTSLQKDLHRLAQLNKKMVLLTKIENKQFSNSEKIELNLMLKEALENFRELTAVPLFLQEENELEIIGEPQLAQILVNNLISNAVKNCAKDGEVKLVISGSSLEVRNSGEKAIENSADLFNRFSKGERSPGTGLGLAIVKKICELYGYRLSYNFSDQNHCFSIDFETSLETK